MHWAYFQKVFLPSEWSWNEVSIYLLASTKLCPLSENFTIFIVKAEQYLLRPKRKKDFEKTYIFFIFLYVSVWDEKKKTNNSFNLARSDEPFSAAHIG